MMFHTIVSKIANRIECSRSGCCMFFAEWATRTLFKNKIKNFVVIEGWVKGEKENFWRQHTWIEHEGQRIDPTFIQFDGLNVKHMRRIKRKLTPEEYLSLCSTYPTTPQQMKYYLKK